PRRGGYPARIAPPQDEVVPCRRPAGMHARLLRRPPDGSRLLPTTQEETMQFGYFAMPSHPPERPLKDGHEWDLQVIRWLGVLRPHLKPLQAPHPPIGVAGLSKGSDTLKLAGEKGFLPMSLNLNPAYVGSHWEAVEIGAAKSGRTPDRGEWRMVREVFVADSDEEAMKLSVGANMGRMMREYFLPLLAQFGFFEFLKHDQNVPDSDVTPEYCAR